MIDSETAALRDSVVERRISTVPHPIARFLLPKHLLPRIVIAVSRAVPAEVTGRRCIGRCHGFSAWA